LNVVHCVVLNKVKDLKIPRHFVPRNDIMKLSSRAYARDLKEQLWCCRKA